MKNSNDTIWDRASDLPICATAVPVVSLDGNKLSVLLWDNVMAPVNLSEPETDLLPLVVASKVQRNRKICCHVKRRLALTSMVGIECRSVVFITSVGTYQVSQLTHSSQLTG